VRLDRPPATPEERYGSYDRQAIRETEAMSLASPLSEGLRWGRHGRFAGLSAPLLLLGQLEKGLGGRRSRGEIEAFVCEVLFDSVEPDGHSTRAQG